MLTSMNWKPQNNYSVLYFPRMAAGIVDPAFFEVNSLVRYRVMNFSLPFVLQPRFSTRRHIGKSVEGGNCACVCQFSSESPGGFEHLA